MLTFSPNIRTAAAALLTCCAVLLYSGCDDDLIDSPDQIVFPDTNVSYLRHVQPLFNVSCNFSGCHSLESRAGDLALISHFDVTLKPGMVIAGEPDRSLLVQIVRGTSPHPASFQARVNQNHKDGIAQWVLEGAGPE